MEKVQENKKLKRIFIINKTLKNNNVIPIVFARLVPVHEGSR